MIQDSTELRLELFCPHLLQVSIYHPEFVSHGVRDKMILWVFYHQNVSQHAAWEISGLIQYKDAILPV